MKMLDAVETCIHVAEKAGYQEDAERGSQAANELRSLLKACSYAMNMVVNTPVPGSGYPDTYAIASALDRELRK